MGSGDALNQLFLFLQSIGKVSFFGHYVTIFSLKKNLVDSQQEQSVLRAETSPSVLSTLCDLPIFFHKKCGSFEISW